MEFQKITKQRDGSFAYWVEGKRENPPLILIPGFTGTHGDLLQLARELKNKFFIIIPEFPGWGATPEGHSSYTITSYAHLIKLLIDELSLSKVSLVAHCMGAVIALEAAHLFPERIQELILISTPYQEGTVGNIFFRNMAEMSEKVPRFLSPLFFFWRSRVITIPMSFFVLQTRTLRRKLCIISQTLQKQSRQDEHILETNWNSLIEYNYGKLKSLPVRVVLLHGENDLLIPPSQAEKLSKLLPKAIYAPIPHAGHLPPVETPQTVAHMIKEYLK